MSVPTHGRQDIAANLKDNKTRKINNETLTKAICNKGFSGNSSILPRIKFCVGGQESSPQSLTAYSLDRYRKPYLTTLLTLNRMTLTTYSDKIGQQLTLLLRADPSEKKQKNCLRTKKFYAYAHCTHLPLPATARSQPKGKVKRVQSPTL